MLKNEFFKYKLIAYTLCALCLCALLSALSVLGTPTVHASPRCADLVSSSSDSSIRDLPPSNTNTSMKNALESFLTRSALDFFASSKTPTEITKGLQSYIGELLEKKIIGDPELIRFIEHLEKGELINPITTDEALTSTSLLVQRRGLQRYLDKSSLDQKELLAWSRATLEKRARVRVRRGEVREKTQYQRLEFHPVKRPVRFKVRDKKNKKWSITLTHPIEVQSTPVTQRQWVEIMGENPSRFVEGEESVVLTFDGKEIELQPDNPVENVTFWSVLEFANRLSEKHGLQPAYDLSDMDWKPDTRPEDGTLETLSVYDQGDKVRIYAKGKSHDSYEGDIYYRAEGYRLPTLAEQFYMLQGGGRSPKDDILFKNEADLKKHAWYQDNSGGRTHPVGLLQPIVIDGEEFYDLYGHVGEWGWGRGESGSEWGWNREDYGNQYKFRSQVGKNPMGPNTGGARWVSGGGLFSSMLDIYFVQSGRYRSGWERQSVMGFRLVRTIGQGDSE